MTAHQTPRRTAAVGLFVVAVLVLVAGASAATPSNPLQLKVTPAAPSVTKTVTFSFRADGKLKPDQRYRVAFRSDSPGPLCFEHGEQPVIGFTPRGTIVPLQFKATAGATGLCPGPATYSVWRIDVDGHRLGKAQTLHVSIARDPRAPLPTTASLSTPVKLSVLDGSSITVRAPGRPDRILPVGGVFTGLIPGKFVLNTDYTIKLETGSLDLGSLVTDPLCAGTNYALRFALNPAGSSLLTRDGKVSMTIPLGVDPLLLAGCSTTASGATTLNLTGSLGAKKLADIAMTATVDGIPIATGVVGTATADLHIKIAIGDSSPLQF